VLPTLHSGDFLFYDNLSSHLSQTIKTACEERGIFYIALPQYSPDLNPIEKAWSKIKAFLRAIKARTLEDLDRAVVAAFDAITLQDIAGWFKSCGYVAAGWPTC